MRRLLKSSGDNPAQTSETLLELYEATLQHLPLGLILSDDNNDIVFVNPAAEAVRRIKSSEKVGTNIIDCHPPHSRERVTRALQYLKKEGTTAYVRHIADKVAGKYYENTYAPIRDASGQVIGSVVVSQDITEKRKFESERAAYLSNLQARLEDLTEKNQQLFNASMDSLVTTLEAKDPYTKGHSLRVSEMAVQVAEEQWGITPEVREIELAGKFHDLGKVGIRDAVLNKPGKLEKEEMEHIATHPLISEKILSPLERLKNIAKIVRHHHERYDGNGYPDGLRGDEIPEGARILAIADSYDAMTSSRPYRSAMETKRAAEIIKQNLGTQFDPKWGEAFLDLFMTGSIG